MSLECLETLDDDKQDKQAQGMSRSLPSASLSTRLLSSWPDSCLPNSLSSRPFCVLKTFPG